MAEREDVHVPEDFFEREEISIEDIREIIPKGQSLPRNALLQSFSGICRSAIRRQTSWKKLCINGSDNKWGLEGHLGLKDMIQSGLLTNLEDLLLADFSDFGDSGIMALAESLKSGQLSSLRHLKLHYVGFLERLPRMGIATHEDRLFGMDGAEALASWLESDHARTLTSLSIKGRQWSYHALALLLQSFRKGAVQSLVELELRCYGFEDSVDAAVEDPKPELAIVAELSNSLNIGQVDTLRRLKLQSTGYEINALASLAQCCQLRRLEYLEISGTQGVAEVGGHEAATALAFQTNNLQNLEVLKFDGGIQDDAAEILFSSMEAGNFNSLRTLALNNPWVTRRKTRAIAKWLQSGHASNVVELCIFDSNSSDMDLVIDACFSGKAEKLEKICLPLSQYEEDKALKL